MSDGTTNLTPALSSEERESSRKHVVVFMCGGVIHRHEDFPRRGNRIAAPLEPRTPATSPSPGGEGWGEGGRFISRVTVR
jgi:hypothetical protein